MSSPTVTPAASEQRQSADVEASQMTLQHPDFLPLSHPPSNEVKQDREQIKASPPAAANGRQKPAFPKIETPARPPKQSFRISHSRRSTSLDCLSSLSSLLSIRPEREKKERTKHPKRSRSSKQKMAAAACSKTEYFEQSFKAKNVNSTMARDRVLQTSPVIAQLRTNVVVRDEYTLITSLSAEIAERYQRLETSVTVGLEHSSCVIMGGSFDPTYTLYISACPDYIKPFTNSRNATLLQNFLQDLIGVPPSRGLVVFRQIPEEMLAISGETVWGQVRSHERECYGTHAPKPKPATTKTPFLKSVMSKSGLAMKRQKSMPMISGAPSDPSHRTSMASSARPDGNQVSGSNASTHSDSGIGTPTENKAPAGLSDGGPTSMAFIQPPAIPDEPPMKDRRVKPRKSLMNMLRKSKSRGAIAV